MAGLVAIKMERVTTRLKAVIAGLGALDHIGEVYVENPRMHAKKVRRMAGLGHDPLELPLQVIRASKRRLKKAIMRGGRRLVLKALANEADYYAGFLRKRIITGKLGTMAPSTISSKMYAVARGAATSKYGRPPPYGVLSGGFLSSIKARVKARKGKGRSRGRR